MWREMCPMGPEAGEAATLASPPPAASGRNKVMPRAHWLSGEEPACQERARGSVPGWGRSPGGRNGNPLQCSCLKNPMDRGAWQATVHSVTQSDTAEASWHSTAHGNRGVPYSVVWQELLYPILCVFPFFQHFPFGG